GGGPGAAARGCLRPTSAGSQRAHPSGRCRGTRPLRRSGGAAVDRAAAAGSRSSGHASGRAGHGAAPRACPVTFAAHSLSSSFVPLSEMKLPRTFYDRPTLEVARDLLGLVLVHDRKGVVTSGVIVEVEAYIGESDPACHAAPGPTRRNAPLYGAPGHAYVYLNYGIHCLVNVVTESHGSPAAVLIRALDPLDGIDVMRRRRARAMKGRRRMSDAASTGIHDLCP